MALVDAQYFQREAAAQCVGRFPPNLPKDWATSALVKHGVNPIDMHVLHSLLLRWGEARIGQILALWTFLGSGDVGCRPAATDALQLWGPAAAGKTSILKDFLNSMQVQSVWLNCACFASIGELNGQLIELVRQEALKVEVGLGSQTACHTPIRGRSRSPRRRDTPPKPVAQTSGAEWMNAATQSSAPRALDRLLRGLQGPLEALSRSREGATKPYPLVIVLDQAQALPKLGTSFEHCLRLPSLVKQSGPVVVVTISRLPLQLLGLNPLREPPAVAFPGYSADQAASICFDAEVLERSPLIKMATHRVGQNYSMLKGVVSDAVDDGQVHDVASMQKVVERSCKRRLGLCDMSHLTSDSGAGNLSLTEKRMLVATFLASYVPKDDDGQLFLPMGQRRKRRVLKRAASATAEGAPSASSTPIAARHPQVSSLIRVMAIFSKISRQPQSVGPEVLQAVMQLKDAGLVRLVGDKSYTEKDAKVISCAKLPLARSCATALGIDLPEYLVTR
mmetsp:Transcript_7513/g.13527  ORF Transcript_7513/g.13527 Transcript_7513/m.13527 type:complete len:506 (+) Transcript_7513:37-1554(+)